MTDEPRVEDARNGLRPAAIEMLRQAETVSLGLKDRDTALIGAWSAGRPEPDVLLIRAASRWEGAPVPQPPPLLLIRDAQRDLWWRQAIDACRPGDVPILRWWDGRLSLELVADAPTMERSPVEAAAAAGRRPFLIVQPADRSGLRDFPLGNPSVQRRPCVGDTTVVYQLA